MNVGVGGDVSQRYEDSPLLKIGLGFELLRERNEII